MAAVPEIDIKSCHMVPGPQFPRTMVRRGFSRYRYIPHYTLIRRTIVHGPSKSLPPYNNTLESDRDSGVRVGELHCVGIDIITHSIYEKCNLI
jgi:hypothetical protein